MTPVSIRRRPFGGDIAINSALRLSQNKKGNNEIVGQLRSGAFTDYENRIPREPKNNHKGVSLGQNLNS